MLLRSACLQILERIPEDEVVEANLDSVIQHPHGRFCTTLGVGDNRYRYALLKTLAAVATGHIGFNLCPVLA